VDLRELRRLHFGEGLAGRQLARSSVNRGVAEALSELNERRELYRREKEYNQARQIVES
jgi:hypothetical protein